MLFSVQTNSEEIEQDPEDGEGWDGEDHPGEACEFTSGDNGEKYQDGVHVEGLALDAGGQEVAFELLDQDVGNDRQDGCGRRGLEVRRPEDEGHYDRGYTPEEGAKIGDDRRDRHPHAEQDGVAHTEQIQRRSGQDALDHDHEDESAEVARERLAEGFPQVAGVVAVVGRYGLQKSRLHLPHIHQEVDRDEEYTEERYPEGESPGDKAEEAPEQVLGKGLGAVEEIGDQPPAELLWVRAGYQLAFVQRVYHVEQELVGAVGDPGRGPYEGAQLLYQERHEEEESQRDQAEHGHNGQQDRQPSWHDVRERPRRKREHDGERHPTQRHGGNGRRRVQKEREQGKPHHDDADPDPRRDEDRGHVAAGRRFPLLILAPPGPPFFPHRLRFSPRTRLRILFYAQDQQFSTLQPPASACQHGASRLVGTLRPSGSACQHGASRLVGTLRPSGSACQHATFGGLSARFGPFRPSLSACQLLLLRLRLAAHDEASLRREVGSYAPGEAKGRLAEVLRSRLATLGGGLTSAR